MEEKFNYTDFFNFKILIFPKVAKILYIFLVAIIFLIWLGSTLYGLMAIFSVGVFYGFSTVAASTVITAFILILSRIWFEVGLIFFNINNNLEECKKNKKNDYNIV